MHRHAGVLSVFLLLWVYWSASFLLSLFNTVPLHSLKYNSLEERTMQRSGKRELPCSRRATFISRCMFASVVAPPSERRPSNRSASPRSRSERSARRSAKRRSSPPSPKPTRRCAEERCVVFTAPFPCMTMRACACLFGWDRPQMMLRVSISVRGGGTRLQCNISPRVSL